MTGIERLRELAEDYISHSWSEVGKTRGRLIFDIADQIERECACDADTIENVRLIVGGIIDDMERHVSGVEVADDSPVARWARELRDALKSYTSDGRDTQNPSCADPDGAAGVTSDATKVTRYPAEDVSMSACDLLPEDEREAIAWVREHGGLDYVKKEWRSRVPHDRYEARRQRLLGHIAECETALGRRREIISKLGHRVSDLTRENAELRRRAMPESCEWPRYESGDLVMFGDCVENRNGTCTVNSVRFYSGGGVTVYGEGRGAQFVVVTEPVMHDPIRKANPKVLAADGEPLEVGQTVYALNDDRPYTVKTVEHNRVRVNAGGISFDVWKAPTYLTHQSPVLDADGVPIKKGDTVWFKTSGEEMRVDKIEHRPEGFWALELFADGSKSNSAPAVVLTHTKPEIDSWQRIEEDVMVDAKDYCESRGIGYEYPKHSGKAKCEDIVRRCRALAERERCE